MSQPPSLPVSVGGRLILVVGPTGAGKSTFINAATGQNDCTISHGLKSSTSGITTVEIRGPDGRPIILVDTPGLDDAVRADIEVFALIMEWLVETCKRGFKLAGILYLHQISAPRMTDSIQKNIHLFSSIGDMPQMPHVVLVTTFWGGVPAKTGTKREAELEDTFLKDRLANGRKTMRFTLTDKGGRKSAWDIINHLLSKEPTNIPDQSDVRQVIKIAKTFFDKILHILEIPIRKLGQLYNKLTEDVRQVIKKAKAFFYQILHILGIPFMRRLHHKPPGHWPVLPDSIPMDPKVPATRSRGRRERTLPVGGSSR